MKTESTHTTFSQELPPTLPVEQEKQNKLQFNWHILPMLLRWVGGTTLIVAAFSFLLSGWVDATSLSRYYSFLALTAALSLCGLFCITRWKDDKGARTFLALATAFLPAHFSMLGGITYAELFHQLAFQGKLNIFSFSPIGMAKLGSTLLAAAVVLIPISFMGFSAMARSEAKKLTAVFFLANALLLIPLRDSSTIALISFITLAALIAIDRFIFAKNTALKSWDGIAVRTLLFVPMTIIVFRSLLLHNTNDLGLIWSWIYTALAALLFLGLPQCTKSKTLQNFSQNLSFIPAFLGWFFFVDSFPYQIVDSKQFFAALIVIPFCLAVGGLSFLLNGSGTWHRRMAAMLAMVTMLLQLLAFSTPTTSLICLITAIAVIIAAFSMQDKGLLSIGILGFILSALYHVRFAITLYQENIWLSLAITGTTIVLLSSFIEKNGKSLIERSATFRSKLNTWK